MTLLETIKNHLSKKISTPNTPDGLCPNCWGRQEYEGEFFEAVKADGLNTLNLESKKGWVEAYIEKNLTGIQLQPTDSGLVCNYCHTRYVLNEKN